jgi:hypothetical protein
VRLDRPKRSESDRNRVVDRGAVAIRDLNDVEAPAASKIAPLEERVSLDDEIKQLRNQLARKLHLQNNQLRKMLERFDRT